MRKVSDWAKNCPAETQLNHQQKRTIRQIISLLVSEDFINTFQICKELNIGYDLLLDLIMTDYFKELYNKFVKNIAGECLERIIRDTQEKSKGVDISAVRRVRRKTGSSG